MKNSSITFLFRKIDMHTLIYIALHKSCSLLFLSLFSQLKLCQLPVRFHPKLYWFWTEMRTIFSINVLKPTTLQVIFRLYITTSLYIFWYSMPNVILFAAMRSKREYMYTYTGSKYWEIICHKTWNTLWSESNRVSGKHLVEWK